MLTCDWLVGKLSVDRDLAKDLEPINTFRLFKAISVRKNTLDMYAELSPRIPNAVRRNFAGVTLNINFTKFINFIHRRILFFKLFIISPSFSVLPAFVYKILKEPHLRRS